MTSSDNGPRSSTHGSLRVDEEAKSSISDVKDAAQKLAESAKASVSDYAATTVKAFQDATEQQKTAGAGAIGDVARAAKDAAQGFEESSPQFASVVRTVADKVEVVSNDIRDRSIGELTESVLDFAKQRPAAFFGCGIVVGVVLARLFSSSSR
jgi:hypothetical protein